MRHYNLYGQTDLMINFNFVKIRNGCLEKSEAYPGTCRIRCLSLNQFLDYCAIITKLLFKSIPLCLGVMASNL